MANLYEILEVSEKASKEVIEKAYRVLAKKYHPDLQEESQKQEAERKMKQINEAYDILSNEEKRKQYDIELEQTKQEEKQINAQQYENNMQKENQNIQSPLEYQASQEQIDYENRRTQMEYENRQKIQNEMNKAYHDAYYTYLRRLGFKIKEPWTLKRVIDLLKVILILAIIIAILWFFPPTHRWIIEFYEGNTIVKTIVDILSNILQGIWNAIVQFIQNLGSRT